MFLKLHNIKTYDQETNIRQICREINNNETLFIKTKCILQYQKLYWNFGTRIYKQTTLSHKHKKNKNYNNVLKIIYFDCARKYSQNNLNTRFYFLYCHSSIEHLPSVSSHVSSSSLLIFVSTMTVRS